MPIFLPTRSAGLAMPDPVLPTTPKMTSLLEAMAPPEATTRSSPLSVACSKVVTLSATTCNESACKATVPLAGLLMTCGVTSSPRFLK
jgi:hypothetical protein